MNGGLGLFNNDCRRCEANCAFDLYGHTCALALVCKSVYRQRHTYDQLGNCNLSYLMYVKSVMGSLYSTHQFADLAIK